MSRTSTHATSVPITAPIAATISEAPTVIASARRASVLSIELQNVLAPDDTALTATAASGISTITLR
ncbi:MAG: hypothetical protein JO156_00620 [Solirubrobacterales bacterium]|nr:hypothetical protein [Solirubrobacterales bacterium]